MTQSVTQAIALDVLNVYWDTATSVRLMLYDGTLTSTPPSEAELFAAEVVEANGYSRNAIAPTTPAVWNAANNAGERTMQNSTITADGGTIIYNACAFIRNGAAQANKVATADSENNSFTVTAHGLTTGDRLLITADDTATLPAGLSGTTFYYAEVTDTDTFTLRDLPVGGAGIGFTSDGAGTLRLRYAAGKAGWFEVLTTSRTIDPAGDAHPFTGLVAYMAV
jgi:hypothetical protein